MHKFGIEQMNWQKIISSVFFVFICVSVFSQTTQSEENKKKRAQLSRYPIDSVKIQSSKVGVNELTIFKPISLLEVDEFHRIETRGDELDLGNSGTVINTIFLKRPIFQGFRSWYSVNHLPFYRVYDSKFPVTIAKYSIGSQQDQQFGIFHTQSISQRVNFSFELDKVNSIGFYEHLHSNNDRITGGIRYDSKRKRYEAIAHVNYSYLANQVNGGVLDDSLIQSNIISQSIPVNFQETKFRVRNLEANLFQYYYPGKVKNDSSTIEREKVPIRFGHQLNYKETNRYFSQKGDTLFYDNFFVDSLNTNENLKYTNFSNRFFVQKNSGGFNLSAGIGNEIITTSQEARDSSYLNTLLEFSLFKRREKGLRWDFGGKLYLSGYNSGDLYIDGKIYLPINNGFLTRFIGKGSFDLYEPELEYQSYHSNQYRWRNDWNKVAHKIVGGSFEGKGNLKLDVEYHLVGNAVYLDDLGDTYSGNDSIAPVQEASEQSVLKISIDKKTKFLKKMYLRNKIVYQDNFNSSVYRLPKFYTRSSLYIQGKMFKNALFCQLGAELTYFTSFKMEGFSAPLGRYYNLDSDQSVGDYAYVDFFLNGRIGKANIFLKASHANFGFSGRNFFVAPKYASQQMSLRFGVKWVFFN